MIEGKKVWTKTNNELPLEKETRLIMNLIRLDTLLISNLSIVFPPNLTLPNKS